MVGDGFEVDFIFQGLEQNGFSRAGASAKNDRCAGKGVGVEVIQQVVAKGFIASLQSRDNQVGFLGDPLLANLRAHSATKAVEPAVGAALELFRPRSNSLRFYVPAYQLVSQLDGFGIPFLFIANADEAALLIVHQRQIHGIRKRPAFKFNRCAHINEWNVIENDLPEVAGGG